MNITQQMTDEFTNLQRTIRQSQQATVERVREMWCPACGSLSGFINRQPLISGGEYVNVTFQRIADEHGKRGSCPCCSRGISINPDDPAFAAKLAAFGVSIHFDHKTGNKVNHAA
jgi:hypothetical protein